jgi:hypothetical protein
MSALRPYLVSADLWELAPQPAQDAAWRGLNDVASVSLGYHPDMGWFTVVGDSVVWREREGKVIDEQT